MDIGSYRGEFLTMPTGTRIVSLNEELGTVTLTLSKEFSRDGKDKIAERFTTAIVTSLRQFKGVSSVRILVEGNDLALGLLRKNPKLRAHFEARFVR